MAIRRNKYLFIIIATQDNKIESWSLVIADTIYNHPLNLPGAHPIYWQFAYMDKIKKFIISQIYIRASSKQVIATI